MIIVAGVGPGSLDCITMEVYNKILNTNIVLAFGRVYNSFKFIREDMIKIEKIPEVLDIIHQNKEKDILLLASGDPNFYGIVNYLKKKDIFIDLVLPGISSFQYMLSKLQISWENINTISMHGEELNLSNMESIKNSKISILLTDKENNPYKISKIINKLGIKGYIFVGSNLSYKDEKIERFKIGDKINNKMDLSVMVIINEMD